ncbi:MAG: phosphate/phosphite/phosphonate ABC transporter substrate-binding protein [Pseudomonadota bacterium]
MSGERGGEAPLGDGLPRASAAGVPGPALGSGRPLTLAFDSVSSDLDEQAWAPLTARVEQATGLLIEVQRHDGYGDIVDAITAGRADLALLPPLAYVQAREEAAGLEPLVHALVHGKTTYSAYLFVRRDAPVETAADLRGRRVAFVDELSTSGFLFPYAALLDVGLDPARDLGAVAFTGDHVASLRALTEGRVDAAASFADALPWARAQAASEGWELPELRVLVHAGRIPLDVLCAGPSLGAPLREQVREVLLTTNTTEPAGRAFYASSGRIVGWAPASDALFDPVRRVRRRVAEHRREAAPPDASGATATVGETP